MKTIATVGTVGTIAIMGSEAEEDEPVTSTTIEPATLEYLKELRNLKKLDARPQCLTQAKKRRKPNVACSRKTRIDAGKSRPLRLRPTSKKNHALRKAPRSITREDRERIGKLSQAMVCVNWTVMDRTRLLSATFY
jgi:hypothetical protein